MLVLMLVVLVVLALLRLLERLPREWLAVLCRTPAAAPLAPASNVRAGQYPDRQ